MNNTFFFISAVSGALIATYCHLGFSYNFMAAALMGAGACLLNLFILRRYV